MKEKDIHDLIEQQNSEVKQRILEKVVSKLPELIEQTTVIEKNELDKGCKSSCSKEKSPR